MALLAILVVFAAIFVYLLRKPHYILTKGEHLAAYRQGQFYIEEVAFADYHQALHHYFALVDDVEQLGKVLEVQYSYLDWTTTLFRFEHCSIKLARCINKVRLIQSQTPTSLPDFERAIEQAGL